MNGDFPVRERASTSVVPPAQKTDVCGRLQLVRQAFAGGPLDAGTPRLVASEAAAASGAREAVVCVVDGDRLDVLASHVYEPPQDVRCGSLQLGDLSLPLTYAATTGEPVWLESRAEAAARFPQLQRGGPQPERAYAMVPLRVAGTLLGVLGIGFGHGQRFCAEERDFLMGLADVCAVHLHQWGQVALVSRQPTSAATLGRLVLALSDAETADEVAQVIAEEGATAAAAAFANVALPSEDDCVSAQMIHARTLDENISTRYTRIGIDETTPLGVVLGTGAEVWLRSLTDVGARFPALLGDTRAAGLCATASLPLRDSDGALIGAMGLAWTAPQQFADDQRDEVRVVAQLAADGLRRARKRDRVAQLTVALNSNAARLSALQNVTAALATAVTTDEIAHVVVSQAIPLIGDHGLVAVLSHDGQSLRTWTSPTQSPHVQDAITIVPLAADLAVAAVVRDDTPHQAQTLLEMTARSPQNADVYRQWNTHSLLIVPAHAAGRPVGALALGFTREHAVDDDVVAFATTLADLMGQALQRAAQYERHAHVAEVLQRSLLPTLPEIVGLELAAVYSPGDQGAQIGGDWYEVFDLGAGQVYLVIGDVMGHDVRAAAVMGQLRAAVHAYASVGHSPAQVLARLHVMIDELADIDLVTCLCAVYDIGQGSLTIANAGHPPPLTAAPGRPTSVLPLTPGPALGAGTGTYTEQTYDVTPGTLLTFFTDGVVETRGQDIDLGIRRLMSFLDASAHRPLATLARDAVAYMGADHARDDDAALLQLRATL